MHESLSLPSYGCVESLIYCFAYSYFVTSVIKNNFIPNNIRNEANPLEEGEYFDPMNIKVHV